MVRSKVQIATSSLPLFSFTRISPFDENMERTSILHLLRAATTRPQSFRSSTRYLSTFSRKQDGIFWYPTRARSASLATKRYTPPIYRILTRYYSALSEPPTEALNVPSQNATDKGDLEPLRDAEGRPTPTYQLSFTCKPCMHRSTHNITKLSYHTGAVLVQCPECKNRHVISDHLGIFSDERQTIENILKKKGEFVKRGTVNGEGDIEFWDDKSSLSHPK
jgi:protein import protein ZIM17